MQSRFLFALALAADLFAQPVSAALSRPEQAMIGAVDSEQQRTLAMLERWVDRNSGTMNKAGVEAVRDMVAPEFRQLGFTTQWIDMSATDAPGTWSRAMSGAERASGCS